MRALARKEKPTEDEAAESVRKLLKAGLELGVAEAVRRIVSLAPAPNDRMRNLGAEAMLAGATVVEIIQIVRNDPGSVFQLAKEVWSRGGKGHKEDAAEAVGKGLGALVPHRALEAARDLAAMARGGSEADLVGRKAIGPILERNPMMLDRVKKFLGENERLIRQAAIAGLVAFVARKRKFAALGIEIVLLVAEEHEKEIRAAVKWALKQIQEVDARATAKAVGAWAKANPTAERLQFAGAYLKQKAGNAKLAVERRVVGAMSRLGNGHKNGSGKAKPAKRPQSPSKR